jgi:hypothetical protein
MPTQVSRHSSYATSANTLIDNPLQIAVLNLFVTLKSRFPNLVVGTITRDSIRKAFSNGIHADQVAFPFVYRGRVIDSL